ncbi:MAG: ATP-binding protein [Candidatus Caldarchaeum sp.]|nr:ATP-binding protein [Candidatus Caldarchaeum sp.]MDW7977580.1 ATP-binding protein [Candidatus Caldarchaeum sp.]
MTEKGVAPQSVFYLDLDMVASLREFRELMEYVVRQKRKQAVKTAYVFLDEVASVREWWKVFRFLVDRGDFMNDVVTVLGSSTLGLVKAPEMFPGRRGFGKNVEVLPVSFPELIRVNGLSVEEVVYRAELLHELWNRYLELGGFPKSLNGHPDAGQALVQSVVGEVYRAGKNPAVVQDILGSVITKMPSAMSYSSVAQELGISHTTVREYLELLTDTFIIGLAHFIAGGRKMPRKEKKIFFRDPFSLRTLASWAGVKPLESALVEGVVQEHLLRKFGEVYYFRNEFEVDVIAGGLKVEVKTGKPHRRYPKDVEVLSDMDVPRFLIRLGL